MITALIDPAWNQNANPVLHKTLQRNATADPSPPPAPSPPVPSPPLVSVSASSSLDAHTLAPAAIPVPAHSGPASSGEEAHQQHRHRRKRTEAEQLADASTCPRLFHGPNVLEAIRFSEALRAAVRHARKAPLWDRDYVGRDMADGDIFARSAPSSIEEPMCNAPPASKPAQGFTIDLSVYVYIFILLFKLNHSHVS